MKTKTLVVLVLIALGIFGSGCIMEEEPDGPILFENDSSIRDDTMKGLDLKVTDFSWRFNDRMDRVEINGTVRNMSSEGIQGIRMLAVVYDQFGTVLAQPMAYVTPTYVEAGAEAKFDLQAHRGRWVKAVRVKYYFENRY
jgi:hypothetical protein